MAKRADRIQLPDLEQRVQLAVETFWRIRRSQRESQGTATGHRDAGSRADVTGGRHLDGFVELIRQLVNEHAPGMEIRTGGRGLSTTTNLPGYFRPCKTWDVVVTFGETLVGCLELKSHVGPSFGNNYNNRSEEAIGSAFDVQTAYREGAFEPSPKPWIGYLMLLEETPGSTRSVRLAPMPFAAFQEYQQASYARRYEVGLTRLVREGLYTAAALIMTNATAEGPSWHEPCEELTTRRLIASLIGHALAVSAER